MVSCRIAPFLCACLVAAACGRGAEPPAPVKDASDGRVRALADAYLDGFFARNPDQITLFGVPGRRHDQLPDNSLNALRAWQARGSIYPRIRRPPRVQFRWNFDSTRPPPFHSRSWMSRAG